MSATTRSEKLLSEALSKLPGLLEARTGQLPSALKHPTGSWVPTGTGTHKV